MVEVGEENTRAATIDLDQHVDRLKKLVENGLLQRRLLDRVQDNDKRGGKKKEFDLRLNK